MSRSKHILMIGAGGHARACIDVVEAAGFKIFGLVALADEVGHRVLDYPVIGTEADLLALSAHVKLALVVIGQLDDPKPRQAAVALASSAGFDFPAIVSPYAHVSRHSFIGEGTIVMHGAIVNAASRVGKHCIINSQSLVEHDSTIGDFGHLSTRAVINGGVLIGDRCFIGSGSVLRQGLCIGSDCFIPMGSIVKEDLSSGNRLSGRR
jgi:sugar O-acyltransferase (sialic acid O-acetyltransferase NeuD family)